jgi:ABC-type multidrug transport system permease subunit
MTISIVGVALMFVSGIVMPVEAMPQWEQVCAKLLPMFYAADAFKGVILGTPAAYIRDSLILSSWAVAGLVLATIILSQRKAAL